MGLQKMQLPEGHVYLQLNLDYWRIFDFKTRNFTLWERKARPSISTWWQ